MSEKPPMHGIIAADYSLAAGSGLAPLYERLGWSGTVEMAKTLGDET